MSTEWTQNAARREMTTMLLRSPPPSPQCAAALETHGEDGWSPGEVPWLQDDQEGRERALEAIGRAYAEASDGLDLNAAANLARETADHMTAGAGPFMRRAYLEAAARPTIHQQSSGQLMTLAADMEAEDIAAAAERIAMAPAENAPERMAFAIGMLLRRVDQAEAAGRTGQVYYTNATDTHLAARIETAHKNRAACWPTTWRTRCARHCRDTWARAGGPWTVR